MTTFNHEGSADRARAGQESRRASPLYRLKAGSKRQIVTGESLLSVENGGGHVLFR